MKKIYTMAALAAAILTITSCKEEWEPVFTGDYDAPEEQVTELDVTTTIAELKAMYTSGPLKIDDDIVIKGQVTTSDKAGNLYRTFYIQDETGGIEIKIGKSYTNMDYRIGQWLYIKCEGLTLGQYGGMLQLGYDDPTGSYETAYIEVQYIIDTHIFKGKRDTPVAPKVLGENDLNNAENYGIYCEVQGVTYGNEIFAIIYDDSDNSLYLSEGQFGVDTWAMSENGFKAYMTATTGKEEPQEAFGGKITEKNWQAYYNAAAALSVSQYFKLGNVDLQVRSSGYASFADEKLPADVLSGTPTTLRGILTIYNTNTQFLLIDNSSDYVIY
ncbi:MAG: DUF5689 domain-containing protein [Bacteroidales bacterium]|nr:DUF5689 domain-containing protein [Bacteroidales bacterium]